ncbi:MAG: thymidine phosphorylase [Aggregatilineales bacterium]
MAKMSGRGLGFSGGTLDKMESFSGYNIHLSDAEFHQQAREHGIVLAGQTGELAPADGKLYALRDVTATIESIPLIAASIMSKKLAAGANGIVLDVKWGNGAFMSTLESARNLAHVMVDIGKDAGRNVIAVLSDMNQPLGNAVGNALEVREAIDCLHGAGPDDFREHCLEIATHMLHLEGHGEKWTDDTQTRKILTEKLDNGEALAKFTQLVEIQGGDVTLIEHPEKLPQAAHQKTVYATASGYIETVTALEIAHAALALGAGREKKGDTIDLSAGVEIFVNVGDEITAGDKIAVIHASSEDKIAPAETHIIKAISYSDTPVQPLALFHGIIT